MKKFLSRKNGQGLVEYGLILLLVTIVVIVVLQLLGTSIGDIFSGVVSTLTLPSPTPGGAPPPPECYGSALLPLLVFVMGVMAVILNWVQKLHPGNDHLPESTDYGA